MQYYTHTNKQITLGKKLGSGGEATVYKVQNMRGMAAKIYQSGKVPPAEKLRVMLANPPDDPARSQKHVSIAWIVDLLYTYKGANPQHTPPVGFLMPHIQGGVPLFKLYNPRDRRQHFIGFTWRHLHRVAYNLASAVAAIHAKGYIIGDLNESNILVQPNSLVTLIDTDSFQVRHPGGKIFRSPVGKPEYIAPEIQGHHLGSIDRTEEHDRFALSVLIFLLLMEGSHPFRGSGDPPDLAARIQQGFFPYSANGKPPAQPPPHNVPFTALHAEVQHRFYAGFCDGHYHSTRRPSAADWVHTLKRAEKDLKKCRRNPHHIYQKNQNQCTWCERTQALHGNDPFPTKSQTISAASYKQKPLPAVPVRPLSSSVSPQPRPIPQPQPTTAPPRPQAQPAPRPKPKVLAWNWAFWLQWLVVNTISWGAATYTISLLYDLGIDYIRQLYAHAGRPGAMAVLGGVYGLIIGLSQWFALRKRISKIGTWIFWTVLSFSVFWAINWPLTGLQRSAALGAIVGIGQWLILSRRTRQHGWWPVSSVGGWVVGQLLAQWTIRNDFPIHFSGKWTTLNTSFAGLGYALISGSIMMGFLNCLKPVKIKKKPQSQSQKQNAKFGRRTVLATGFSVGLWAAFGYFPILMKHPVVVPVSVPVVRTLNRTPILSTFSFYLAQSYCWIDQNESAAYVLNALDVEGVGFVNTKETRLNIREGRGEHYDVLAKAEKGETLIVLRFNGDWCKVRLQNGTIGYAHSQYVKLK